mmetsp:Transcript_6789/g.10214  ORF Transcript_6789/g.10214 Transcript_6789/m.10214 type:complete len:197 (+) Transcript_6789:96-686(+)
MRVNRAKQYRKFLRFYKIVYGVSAPYHIILDGNFIYAAVKFKVDIEERIRKVLQGESVTLYVTKSTLNELSSLGTKTKLALEFAQRHCIELNDMSFPGEVASEKLVAFLVDSSHERKGSQRKYVVASQDRELRISVSRAIAGVPLLYLNKVTLVLEPPAGKSRDVNMQLEDAKSAVTPDEIEVLKIIKYELLLFRI